MRPSSQEIEKTVALAGSIRAAAPLLNVDERTIRRWLQDDKRAESAQTTTLNSDDIEGMKLLVLDIETRPALAYVWRMWDENISLDQLQESTEMISWAAKWVGKDDVEFRSSFHDGRKKMVNRMWQLLDEAHAVIHYNGTSFDIPYLNRSFIDLELSPPSPYQQIDLLKVVRRQFKFDSNKLAFVSEVLGLEGKIANDGFRLWLRCLDNNVDAWRQMREYNVRDVVITEKLYQKILPWIDRHPSAGALGGSDICSRCGNDGLQARGYAYTRTGKYRRWVCKKCGAWMRSTKRCDHTNVTEIAAS